jgi:hypothetical protein
MFCNAEPFSGWPGGACIGPECDPDSGDGCPMGSVCLEAGMGGGVCARGCAMDSDCRAGYECTAQAAHPDRMFCGPACTEDSQCTGTSFGGDPHVCNAGLGTCAVAFDDDRLGAECMGRRSCPGGTCIREFDSGFPGAYCTYLGCMIGAPDAMDGCPADGVCIASGADMMTGLCLDGCTADTDCRDGYACRPSDAEDATSPTACLPACTSDDQCANEGFECNQGTGRCTEPFDTAMQGEPCTTATDCPGGACRTEDAEGWPSGMCVAIGCRLSGTGGDEMCPTGSSCIDDGRGDAEIGYCAPTCTVGPMSGCRPGYACTPGAMPTEGNCTPRCTLPTDCSSAMCNVTSGLCE